MELPLEGRVSNAFVEVGPSITLASLSEVLAFAVGSFIPMPACRVFSMFAGYCICCLDFLRAEDNRIDCFPCIKVSGSNVDPEKGAIISLPLPSYSITSLNFGIWEAVAVVLDAAALSMEGDVDVLGPLILNPERLDADDFEGTDEELLYRLLWREEGWNW
ncbi:hypothetical protein FXO38_06311 [Capsicum annuum]|nr:hypothetical protein FXO38_06311 [Capsicum annuum]